MAIAIVLARLLTPREFGIAGMVLVVGNLVVSFADLGVGSALVQRRTIDDRDRSTMFWISLAAGTFFTLLGIGLAFAVAAFYGEPRVAPLFMVFSLAFVLTSLGATQRTLLYRAMEFRSLELRNVAGVVAGAAAAVAAAVLGLGPWALIIQSLTLVGVSTVLLWLLVPWRPQFVFAVGPARELGGFGIRSLGATLFALSNQITDKILVGRFLGAAPLGVYTLAFNTVLTPLSRIVAPITQVFYPAISRLQDDYDGVGRIWLRMNRVVVAIFAPLMLAIIVTAPDLVPIVFGSRWSEAAPVLQILAGGSLVQALESLNAAVFQAIGRPTAALTFSIVSFVGSLGAYALGLHWGLIGVATGFAIANAVLELAFAIATARAIGVSLLTLCRSQAGILLVAGVTAIAMLVARRLLLQADATAEVRLILVLAVGMTVYVLMLGWRERDLLGELGRFVGIGSGRRP